MEPCFPGDGWTPACRWEVVNEFLVLLCLRAQLLFYLLNCLYLNPRVFSLLVFWFSPSHLGGEWVSGYVVLSCRLGLNHEPRHSACAELICLQFSLTSSLHYHSSRATACSFLPHPPRKFRALHFSTTLSLGTLIFTRAGVKRYLSHMEMVYYCLSGV